MDGDWLVPVRTWLTLHRVDLVYPASMATIAHFLGHGLLMDGPPHLFSEMCPLAVSQTAWCHDDKIVLLPSSCSTHMGWILDW